MDFIKENNRIILGDCREILKALPAASVHLIVTSPPYNIGIGYGKWQDYLPIEDYLEFSREWLSECYRVLKDDGRICVNIPIYSYKPNGVNMFYTFNIMKEIGFGFRELIVWAKKRRSDGRYLEKKIYGTWSPRNPMLRNPIEAILIMNKKHRSLGSESKSDLTAKEFLRWCYTIWEIDTESDRTHPAPFPIELPRRLIKLYSFPGQTVLDPFLGSGTTMKACEGLNRVCIGIELDQEYIELARNRVA